MADHPLPEPENTNTPQPGPADQQAQEPEPERTTTSRTRLRQPRVLAGVAVAVGGIFVAAAGGSAFPWASTSQSSPEDGEQAAPSLDGAAPGTTSEPQGLSPDEFTTTTTTATTTTTTGPSSTVPPPEETTTTQPVGDSEQPTAAERFGWELVDEETFDGPHLDTERWTLYDGPGNGGVGWRSPEAISQSDGTLKITGGGDVSGGMNWNDGGRTYGRWEIRARNDAGNGYAPNLLLWPTSGNWPDEGEINIMEIPVGDRSRSLSVLHWGPENDQVWHWQNGDFTQWHNFALEWLPDRVTIYLDGEELVTWDDPEAIPREPMHLAMQNDVGPHDDFIPPRDATTPDEVSLEVDWVRIYAP